MSVGGIALLLLKVVCEFSYTYVKHMQLVDHPRSGVVYNFGRVCLSVGQ